MNRVGSSVSIDIDRGFALAAKRISIGASLVVMIVGIVVLVGWSFGIEELKGIVVPITMKANAALALLLAGCSLLCLHLVTRFSASRIIGIAAAAIVAIIGGLTLSQHIVGWDLGIDQLLFEEPSGALATTSPGRMGPPGSTCFLLVGVALLLLHTGKRVSLAQLLSIIVAIIALLPIVGYAYEAEQLYGIAHYTGIALHTAISFLLLAVGLLGARVDRGYVAVVGSRRAGGVTARRLIVVAIAAPFLLGWLCMQGQLLGYYDLGFGTSILVISLIVIVTLVIVRNAARQNQLEAERIALEVERERLYLNEQAARLEAEEATRLKDEFIATVSHELRTPLTAILGWITLVREHDSDRDELMRAIETIERNAAHQAELVDDLLDLSRISTGRLRIEKEEIALDAVVANAIDSIRAAADAKGIEIVRELDDTELRMQGDAARLLQVFGNLLSNAVKFTPDRGTVRVRLGHVDSVAVVSVVDNGVGIDAEFLPYVFDRFRQADGSISRRYGGLGLGLSIARHIVLQHGGTITAASDGTNRGATFTVTLPLVDDDRASESLDPHSSSIDRAG